MDNQELKSLQENLAEWQERLTYFENQEAKIADLDQKYNAFQHIKKAKEKINGFKAQIEAISTSFSVSIREVESLDDSKNENNSPLGKNIIDINKFESLKNKIQNYNATSKDALEFLAFKDNVLKIFLDDYDNVLDNSKLLKDTASENLFYNIINSESLYDSVKIEINKIRENKESFKSHHRFMIVSALTISIIKYSVFDYRKADYLIDFLSDQEENGVREAALVGLYISLMYRDNKWSRFTPLKKRLMALQNDEMIQNGINQIDQIWRLGLYKSNLFFNKINEIEFFNDKPYNWFIPFFEDNPILIDSLKKAPDDIDTEDFKEFITNLPFLDSFKYIMCDSLVKGEIQRNNPSDSKDKEYFDELKKALTLSENFHPYQNIISNLFSFFTFYPKEKLSDLFDKKKSIIESTNLRESILNRKQKIKLNASIYLQEENYNSAKTKLLELIKIDSTDPDVLMMMSDCLTNFNYEKEIDWIEGCNEALYYMDKLEENFQENTVVLINKRECYKNTEQYSKALECSISIEKHQPTLITHKCYTACLYADLGLKSQFDLKINEIDLQLLITDKDFHYLGLAYSALSDYTNALYFHIKSWERSMQESNKGNVAFLLNIIVTLFELNSKNEIQEFMDIAEKYYSKDIRVIGWVGRAYLILFKDIKQASLRYEKYVYQFEKQNFYYRISTEDIIYIAVWEIACNNIEGAKNTLILLLISIESFTEFKKVFEKHYKYFIEFSSHKITNDLYEEIENYWENEGKTLTQSKTRKKIKKNA